MSPRARFALSTILTVSMWMYLGHIALGNPATGKPPPPVAAPNNGGCASNCAPPPIPASGWVRPVDAPIWQGFRPASNPNHEGVDLGAARGTPIRAASAGTVYIVRCDISDGYTCDQDGGPDVLGCGWNVGIDHPGGIYTLYCHMGRHPVVAEGQTVVAGQILGYVGSSGNSSAPHLHFEVHLNGNRSNNGAVDPVAFMAAHGASLGTGS
jgi:murein DD-endopeptidase MepM/ murein hydrolase activator NlpD